MQRRLFDRAVGELLRPIKNRVLNLMARGVITLVNDHAKVQSLQASLMAGETAEDVENFQLYGFAFKPLAGAEGIALFPTGDRRHGVMVCIGDTRYRIKDLGDGEVAIYSYEDKDSNGHRVHFKGGRVIDIKCDTLNIEADAAINISANNISLSADGTLQETSGQHRITTGDYEADQS